jgi:hypothetical protein
MSTDPSNLTVADRARRTADNIDLIANAASGDQAASLGLDAPSHLVDAIGYDMLYVLDWVERRRGSDTSAALRARLVAVVSALDEAPEQTPEGEIILDLFVQARQLAWSLRNWADDIEAEELQPSPATQEQSHGSSTRQSESQDAAPAIDQESQAIALLFKRPDLSLPEIARAVGVGRTTLYKWPKFLQAAEAAGKYSPKRGDPGRLPRGHKTGDGTLEAWRKPEDE